MHRVMGARHGMRPFHHGVRGTQPQGNGEGLQSRRHWGGTHGGGGSTRARLRQSRSGGESPSGKMPWCLLSRGPARATEASECSVLSHPQPTVKPSRKLLWLLKLMAAWIFLSVPRRDSFLFPLINQLINLVFQDRFFLCVSSPSCPGLTL